MRKMLSLMTVQIQMANLGDNADVLSGCTDSLACNYNSSSTLNTDNTVCTYLDGICETCEGGL